MIWRWDQGRAAYFTYSNIQSISKVLVNYNGANMSAVDSAFRNDLMAETGLPFAPSRYTIKRNYKRVFECSMLASFVGNRLIASDICRAIAANHPVMATVDGYLYEVAKRFRYPYPAFDNYSVVKQICFPFLAMLKLLLSRAIEANSIDQTLTLEDVGSYLIANNVNGLEDIDFYMSLSGKSFSFESHSSSDQKRQVREMMSFIGQHSFLRYANSNLYISGIDIASCKQIFQSLQPYNTTIFSSNPVDDFIKLTAFTSAATPYISGMSESDEMLESFEVEEGKKVFVSHFKIERDSRLRKRFLEVHPSPVCDICERNMHVIYPWTENMLEIHHVKPLSSFQSDEHTTSIDDVVGLCPSCHRAVHIFYREYLRSKNISDFSTDEDALTAYRSAKEGVTK